MSGILFDFAMKSTIEKQFDLFCEKLYKFDGSIEHSEHVNNVMVEFTVEEIKEFNKMVTDKKLNSTNFAGYTYWLGVWFDVDYFCSRNS